MLYRCSWVTCMNPIGDHIPVKSADSQFSSCTLRSSSPLGVPAWLCCVCHALPASEFSLQAPTGLALQCEWIILCVCVCVNSHPCLGMPVSPWFILESYLLSFNLISGLLHSFIHSFVSLLLYLVITSLNTLWCICVFVCIVYVFV